MTINDLLKRIDKNDYDKVLIISNGKGWGNISGKILINESTITIFNDKNNIFSDE